MQKFFSVLLLFSAISKINAAGSMSKRSSQGSQDASLPMAVVGAGAGAGIGAAAAGAGSRAAGAAVGGPLGFIGGWMLGKAISKDASTQTEEQQECQCKDGCCKEQNMRSGRGKHCKNCKA